MATIKVYKRFKIASLLSDKLAKVTTSMGMELHPNAQLLVATAGLIATGVAYAYSTELFTKYTVLADELLHGPTDQLASELVDHGTPSAEQPVAEPCTTVQVYVPGMHATLGAVDGGGADYRPVETQNVRYDMEPIDEKQHRRVRSKKPYMSAVIAEVKTRFGTPTFTAANERAVRRFAMEIMRKHGVRHTEARRMLPLIVNASFIPDKWERQGARMLSNPMVAVWRYEHQAHVAASGYQPF